MKRFNALLMSGLLAASLTCEALAQQTDKDEKPMLKSIIQVNFKDPERQEHGLDNMENILKEAPDAQLEVICHGEGISLLTKKHSGKLDLVKSLMKKGVRFVACENTLRKKSLTKKDLLEGTGKVPSGAIEVIKKQSEGYSYFRP